MPANEPQAERVMAARSGATNGAGPTKKEPK